MDDLNNITLKAFRGGVSPEGDKGPRGSFKFGRGLDIHGERDSLKCNQKLKKDSSTTVTDLPLVIVRGSDGNKYAFGDTGKVYRKIGSGAWALVYTEPDGKISGACEFTSTSNVWILYATGTNVKKITLANAAGTWSGNTVTVGALSYGGNSVLHTMRVAIGVVSIADGPYLAMYDYEDAFNPIALRMPPGIYGNSLLDRNDRVIIGSNGAGAPEGWVVTWDRLADSWLDKKSAQASTVNSMGFLEGGIILQAGNQGHLKYWNFADTYPLKRIPGTQSSRPGAVAEYRTLTHIGMNGGEKNGVYSIGRIDKNDPIAINLEYVPSHGKLTGTEIGALCADGDDLYVSWKDGSTYGIDIIDHDNKAEAVYESLELDMGKPQTEKNIRHIKVVTKPLPDNDDVKVTVKYKTSREQDDWVLASMSDGSDWLSGDGLTKGIFDIEGQGELYEVQVTLTPDGNEAPEVLSINNYFDFDNAI